MRSYIVLLLLLVGCSSPAQDAPNQASQASPEPTQPPGQGTGHGKGGLPCEPPRDYVFTLSDGGTVKAHFPGECPPIGGKESPAIDGPNFTNPKNPPWVGPAPIFPPVPKPGDPK